jgi:carbon monoxide dehydrogenase subunit G
MAELAAVQQLLYRYCHAHDSRDVELLRTCFSKDVTMMGVTGRDTLVEIFANGYKQLTAQRRHVLTNVFITDDGDEQCQVQSYITLYLIQDDKLELHLTGVYRDTLVIEDGEWRIQTRDATIDVPYNPGDTASAKADSYKGDRPAPVVNAAASGAAAPATATVRAHARIARAADEVWKAVSDPAGIVNWFPGVASCTVDGSVRAVSVNGGITVREEIVQNDADVRRFAYRIVGGPVPVEYHQSTVDVLDDGASTIVVYTTEVAPVAMADGMRATNEAAVLGLKQYLET